MLFRSEAGLSLNRGTLGQNLMYFETGQGSALSLPSNATGGVRAAVAATGAYARMRKQFGLSIARFEGVEEALARIGGLTYATAALSRATAAAVDRGEKPAVPSAIAKYHATEWGRVIAGDAMDVHGGKAVQLGPKNYAGRAWQGVPIAITVEGANIMTRSLMIFGQGALRCSRSGRDREIFLRRCVSMLDVVGNDVLFHRH